VAKYRITLVVQVAQSVGPVYVCVRLYVQTKTFDQTTFAQIYGTLVHPDTSYIKFVDQGHRSKFNVTGGSYSFSSVDACYQVTHRPR